jgi:RNA polymerase sigma factor (sigma-70 family)
LDARDDETDEQFADRVDTALMAAFRDTRSAQTFEALYAHSNTRVLLWLRWLMREKQLRLDPVELLQDTFVNVYRYSTGFRDEQPGSFRVWVRTIAANVMRRARHVVLKVGPQLLLDSEQYIDQPHLGPQVRAAQVEESRGLRDAWLLFLQHYACAYAKLSPRDRLALQLVEVDGLGYAETGRRLAVGPSNMKMIMLRARRRLQMHMAAAMGVELAPQATEPAVAELHRRSA